MEISSPFFSDHLSWQAKLRDNPLHHRPKERGDQKFLNFGAN